MAIADFVTKVHAICMDCGDLALFSYRTISDDSLIVLGEKKVTSRCAELVIINENSIRCSLSLQINLHHIFPGFHAIFSF